MHHMSAVQKPMKGFTWSRSTGIDQPFWYTKKQSSPWIWVLHDILEAKGTWSSCATKHSYTYMSRYPGNLGWIWQIGYGSWFWEDDLNGFYMVQCTNNQFQVRMLWEHFWKVRWSQVWHLRSLKCLSAVANADYQIVRTCQNLDFLVGFFADEAFMHLFGDSNWNMFLNGSEENHENVSGV